MNLQYNLKEPDNSHMKRPKNMLRSFVHVEIFNLIAKLCRTRDTDTRRFSLLPCDFVKYLIVLFGIQFFFSSLIRLVWTSSIYHTCVRIAHTLICCSIKRRHCNDSHNSSNTPIRALYIKECEREMVTTCHRSHHHIQSSLKIICAACACFSLFLSLSPSHALPSETSTLAWILNIKPWQKRSYAHTRTLRRTRTNFRFRGVRKRI